ncbi:lysylphosphatidylglycerol synthase transmembrane domain-containing protein [Dactylosporangium sp. NPDC005555]|uniref:lysylphosphatidylglycerol synthase transmembrane domain-containing protein n=1 Tax=Dactylosporangium sp. NPDC005555 TaxID=3154889 RepID=UPI0033A9C54C
MTTRVRLVLLAGGIAVVVWAALHLSSVGASWSGAWQQLTTVTWQWLTGLGVVWLAGLGVHTVVLSAAMPGLTHRRALTLNLAGSALSNVLPLGGVAGTALNLGMVRGWGHGNLDFARFVVVSKAWDAAAKLAMPLVTVIALLASGSLAAGRAGLLWLTAAVLAAGAGLLLVAALFGRAGPLLRIVAFAERLRHRRPGRGAGAAGPDAVRGWTAAAAALLDGTDQLVRRRWASLTWGMTCYWAMQGVLWWLCLVAVGAALPWPLILAGLVAERLLTLAGITPGGAGLIEAGTVAVLIGLGADATGALAGVLLFRAFIFVAEIPVGGVALALWLLTRRTLRTGPSRPEHPHASPTSPAVSNARPATSAPGNSTMDPNRSS